MLFNILDQGDTRYCKRSAFDPDDALLVVDGRELRRILRYDTDASRDGLC